MLLSIRLSSIHGHLRSLITWKLEGREVSSFISIFISHQGISTFSEETIHLNDTGAEGHWKTSFPKPLFNSHF